MQEIGARIRSVAEVLNQLGNNIEDIGLNTWQLRTLSAISRCRTAAMGGHIDGCNACGHLSISYNSCRNRHCPRCQGHKREEWIAARQSELLPVRYFHVVYTLPSALNQLALHQPTAVYDALFAAGWQTLKAFGANQGLAMGMIGVLHTWGQNLSLHPHLHCIVPGGGKDSKGHWQNVRSDGKFLFAVKAMSKVFRAKYVAILSEKIALDKDLREALFKKDWVVYAKRPFGGPAAVVEYLGRYTHKIAISHHRIKAIAATTVSFSYKDYKRGSAQKEMTLTHAEFIRRFSQHILPRRYVRLRHYGFLSSTSKRLHLKALQAALGSRPTPRPALKHKKCRNCKVGHLTTLLTFGIRGPPAAYLHLLPAPQPVPPHKRQEA